jgi:pheromone a factor receptor
MYHIWTKGREVKSSLSSSTDGLGYYHYTRVFMLSGIDILITIPFNIWFFTTWFDGGLFPWPGWDGIHSNWSQLPEVPTAVLKAIPQLLYEGEISRWINVAYGLVFFGFFGVATEARVQYVGAWRYVSRMFYSQVPSSPQSSR